MNKCRIYDAALALWGYDAQVLAVAEECNELAASCTRFVNHKSNGRKIAEEAADVEIMIEQLRHNGMNEMIELEKVRKLARLARRTGCAESLDNLDIPSPNTPSLATLLNDSAECLAMVSALIEKPTSQHWRRAASFIRAGIARQMMIAQMCIREAQRLELKEGKKRC